MIDLSTDLTLSFRKFTADGTAYTISDAPLPTLVFIHGVGMNADVWQSQLEYFSGSYQVIAYDFLGHGQSPLPNDNPTLDDYVEQLNRLIEHVGVSSLSLVGHSMGALLSVAFTLKYPDKVQSLIPINIVFNRTLTEQNRVLQRAEQVIESGEIGNTTPALRRWFEGKDSTEELIKIAKIKQWLMGVSPYGYGRTYRLFALSDKVFVNKLSLLTAPVLYLTGDNDPNSTPAMSKQMADLTPLGEYCSIANEAHMMAYIAHDKTNEVIESFLNKHHSTND
ncbi:MAG TPA: alpha/beta hydrolase [Candidatus Thioglobus sp.]|jgi:pimeloyl-ACP methyl ester carboxylesterase|nr:alpha/beta hydrolase [Candidatus Thioglobus sp.]HIL21344.1 alpha/beta hydrolase [Candidatus Thioglobus sp.]